MTPYWEDVNRGLRIFCADCRDILPTFADGEFGSVVTDPPYGIGFADWDIPPDSAILQQCLRVAEGTVLMFGSWREPAWSHFQGLQPRFDRMAVWAKRYFGPEVDGLRTQWSPMWLWRPCPNGLVSDLWQQGFQPGAKADPDCPRHKTPKPVFLTVELLRRLGGRSTLDPYMSSGTTLVAAAKLGIPAVGIEISERYCEMARCRLEGGFMDDEPGHLFNQEATQ